MRSVLPSRASSEETARKRPSGEKLGKLKTFAINDRSGIQFRAEGYDFINHPNLSGPQLTPTSSQFGEITSRTTLARTLQLSLRFYFQAPKHPLADAGVVVGPV
jgi:hypothetical protein